MMVHSPVRKRNGTAAVTVMAETLPSKPKKDPPTILSFRKPLVHTNTNANGSVGAAISIKELKQQKHKLERELAYANKHRSDIAEQLKAAHAEIAQLSSRARKKLQLEAQVKKLTIDNTLLNERNTELQQKLSDAQSKLQSSKQNTSSLQASISQLNDHLEALNHQLKIKDETIKHLKEEVEDTMVASRNAIAELTEQLDESTKSKPAGRSTVVNAACNTEEQLPPPNWREMVVKMQAAMQQTKAKLHHTESQVEHQQVIRHRAEAAKVEAEKQLGDLIVILTNERRDCARHMQHAEQATAQLTQLKQQQYAMTQELQGARVQLRNHMALREAYDNLQKQHSSTIQLCKPYLEAVAAGRSPQIKASLLHHSSVLHAAPRQCAAPTKDLQALASDYQHQVEELQQDMSTLQATLRSGDRSFRTTAL
eukprot:m.234315 g.234315  ORF g.234315 m.234315 type:complete len:425 (-) comp15255_c1_seq1:500-1774(-)